MIKLVDKSKHLILGTFYTYGYPPLVQAFLRAQLRGVEVYVLLDRSQFSHKYESQLIGVAAAHVYLRF